MFAWFVDNLVNIIIVLAVAGYVVYVIVKRAKNRAAGDLGCGCGCDGCSGCSDSSKTMEQGNQVK